MKLTEIKALTVEELTKQVEDARHELFNLRFRLATKQLVNHREIVKVKKKIARMETIIKERKLGIR